MGDPGEYREGRNPGEHRERVGSGRVPEMGYPGEYQRGARMNTGRRIGEGVESRRVPENHQIKKG